MAPRATRPSMMDTAQSVVKAFWTEYQKTHIKLKVLDALAATAVLTAAIQFLYARLMGTFPFNSFLAGLFCCLSTFTLTVCLRSQVDPTKKDGSVEKAFGEHALAMCVMFLAVWNYMG
ncbi:hypothetical protein H632_c2675p0 [Helicosporidium sp. ATCC 50920]|nr:hypothetical protein H632_c2675p0 [Helicosporidium sp. ATCC 50920]|eukprot:KDD72972.1 hypothetical protein H632_c2675p0 [Helicosporidium sp. ATCC 50920]